MFSDPVEIKKAAEYEKMSEADKILTNEFGYRQEIRGTTEIIYAHDDEETGFVDKAFTIKRKRKNIHIFPGFYSMRELKAISKICEELGWSDK